MDYNFSDLKKKKVINVADGKDLGKITDLIISYPDGRIKSIIVPGKKNAFFSGCELIINFSCIERIGDDTVLVCLMDKRENITDSDCEE
ncbi:MAG: YlmC/YmxH family sporulation protein [Clostridia bacterium]|nr:YlmC/YmxH family sporulation protein [Clostridia bacterium]